jgi:hypothetical protein
VKECYAPGNWDPSQVSGHFLGRVLKPVKGCYAPGSQDPSQVLGHFLDRDPKSVGCYAPGCIWIPLTSLGSFSGQKSEACEGILCSWPSGSLSHLGSSFLDSDLKPVKGCYAPGHLGSLPGLGSFSGQRSLSGLRSSFLDRDPKPMNGCYAPGHWDPSQVSGHFFWTVI